MSRLLLAAIVAVAFLLVGLSAPGVAAASNCVSQSSGSWHDAGTWSCNEVPDSGDTVSVVSPHNIPVASPAEAGTLSIQNGATITLGANQTLAVAGTLSAGGGTFRGAGSVSVAGAFTKHTAATAMTLTDGADMTLNQDSNLDAGSICLHDTNGGSDLHINRTFSVNAGANQDAFSCGNSVAARIHVNAPNGHLVKAGGGLTRSFSGINNDDTVTVQSGTLDFQAGGSGSTSDGAFIAEADTAVVFSNPTNIGTTGRVGGPGAVGISANPMTLAAGAVLDPALLRVVGGRLEVNGTTAQTLPAVDLVGGILDSDRSMTLTSLNVTGGTLGGAATFTIPTGGALVKTTGGVLSVTDGADLVLNENTTLNAGSICLNDNAGGSDLHVNRTFTIAAGANQDAFSCGNSVAARIHVNAPNGHLVKAGGGLTRSFSGINNDDTVTVQSGTLDFQAGGSGSTSDGVFIAEAGTSILFTNPTTIGATGRVGGPGAVVVGANPMTFAAGAVLDPALLRVENGRLDLNGSGAQTLPALEIANGIFDSDRPVTASSLSVTSGTLRGTSTVTIPAGGSFSKTGPSTLTLQDSTDLVLNENATLTGGSICLNDGGGGSDLQINKTFTIGAGANPVAFSCGVSSGLRVHVNAPDGQLVKAGSGTMTSFSAIDVQGRVNVAAGQTFQFEGAYSQSAGVTEVASGGVLQANPALSGGSLQGTGQVTGNLNNTGGTVRPGTSPGTLIVSGNYTQGSGGTLASEIVNGSSFDRLVVNGTASLNGTLAILNSHDPSAAETFEILSAGTRTGTFSTVTGDQLAGKHYQANYDADDVTLSVVLDPPQNTADPTVSGNAVEGETLTCNPGTWTGSPAFEFAWLRDGVPIGGATSQTYVLTGADVGKQISCRVTAENSAGGAQESSSTVTPTAKPAPKEEPKEEPKPEPPAATPPPVTPAGDPPAACKDNIKPATTLKKGGVKVRKGKLTLRGTSGDSGDCASGVQRVQVSIAQVAGRTGVNCRFLRSPSRFSLTRPQNCRKPVLFTATGTDRWTFAVRAKLKPGTYRVQARGVDKSGNKETPKSGRSIVLFTVR